MVNGVVWNHKACGDGAALAKIQVDVDGVTPLHRDRSLASRARGGSGRESPGLLLSGTEGAGEGKGVRRSGYLTLNGDIDDALGLLNRELEQAGQMKVLNKELGTKLSTVEQEVRIWKGRAELLERDLKMAAGETGEDVERLRKENHGLREELEWLRSDLTKRTEEWEEWGKNMKAFVYGKKDSDGK
jgi:chromosome segregation ATPase